MTHPDHHTLVVTEDDGPVFTIECPGVSAANGCVEYSTCSICTPEDTAALDDASEDGDDLPHAHGVEHMELDGEWAARTGNCFAVGHDQLPDAAEMIGATKPGRYWVYVGCDDYYDLVLTSVNSAG